MEEELDWGLEFEKKRDKDDVRLILAETWFLSDMELMSTVEDMFDFSGSDPSSSGAVVSPIGHVGLGNDIEKIKVGDRKSSEGRGVNLKRSLSTTKDGDDQRYSRPTKRVCKESDRARVRVDNNNKGTISTVKRKGGVRKGDNISGNTSYMMNDKLKKPKDGVMQVLSYAERVEKSKLKLREDYDRRSKERGLRKGDNVSGNTMNENAKRSRDDAVQGQLSHKEKLEKSKLKLQQGYDRSKDGRKKTCLISLSEIPKCNLVPKSRKNHLVSRTVCGY